MAKVKRLTASLNEQVKESKMMVEERKETMDRVNYMRQKCTLLGLCEISGFENRKARPDCLKV